MIMLMFYFLENMGFVITLMGRIIWVWNYGLDSSVWILSALKNYLAGPMIIEYRKTLVFCQRRQM